MTPQRPRNLEEIWLTCSCQGKSLVSELLLYLQMQEEQVQNMCKISHTELTMPLEI